MYRNQITRSRTRSSRRTVLVAAAAAAAATAAWSPSASAQAVRQWSGGTSGNGTGWFTSGNWSGGVYAGTYANDASAAKGATDDVALFTGGVAVSGVGVNFSTVTGSPNTLATPFEVGAITSTLTGLSGSATALAVGNSGTSTALNGECVWRLNGATVTVGATGGTINNLIASVSDGATKNLTLQNQSVGTAPTGFSLTYQLGQLTSNVYATAGQNLSIIARISELNAGSSLTKYGAGTLVLGTSTTSNTHGFTGGLTANAGVVSIYSHVNLGSGTVTLNGATLRMTQSGAPLTSSASRAFSLGANGGTVELGSTTTSWTIAGPIGGPGRLTVTGASVGSQVLTLSNTSTTAGSTFTGGVTVTGGATMSSPTTANLGAAPSSYTADYLRLDNGTFTYTDNSGVVSLSGNRGITIGTGGGTLNVAGSAETLVVTAPIVGDAGTTGSLTKLGPGTLRLTGANTYGGPTTVSAGILRDNGTHTGAGAYTVGAAATYGGAGTVTFVGGAGLQAAGTLSPGATLTSTTPSTYYIGTLTLNAPTGGVTLSSGGTAGTLAVDVDPASTVQKIDRLAVNGPLDITGSSVNFSVVNPDAFTTPMVFATYTSLTGRFANESALAASGYTIDYNYQGSSQIALTAVPEPGSAAAAVAVAAVGLLGRRRRARASTKCSGASPTI